MIHKVTIDAVFETARVEEVISDFVNLKKSGANYKGLSPFTNERTASFMVSSVKQIWKDFSSGKGGNVIAFLMEHEHFSYPDAIRYLAKKYNIEIEEIAQTEEEKKQTDARESMFLITDFAKKYFHNTLLESEMGKSIGLSYFKERGFTTETIKTFELGYALEQWDAFTNRALQEGYQLDYLEKTGLTLVKGDKKFDRFRGRVLFPIRSMSGRVLGFGGRILGQSKNTAKYINSPESDIYHKSKVLFGIYSAKKSIAQKNNCYLVEGYTDVIQFYQTGVKNVVSSSGTALTADQIRLIHRLTKNITVLFDGDAAGIRAAIRGIDMILEQGLQVRICQFPEGEDPDSFAKSRSEKELTDFLENNTQDFIQFKAGLLHSETDKSPLQKAEQVRDMVGSISKIPDAIQRELYIKSCAGIMDVSERVLFDTLAQVRNTRIKNQKRQELKQAEQGTKPENTQQFQVVKPIPKDLKVTDSLFELERKIIEILALYGAMEVDFEDLILQENEEGEPILKPITQTAKVYEKIFLDLQEDEIELANANFKAIYQQLLQILQQYEKFEIQQHIHDFTPELTSEISKIILDEDRYTLHRWHEKEIYVKQKTNAVSQYVNDTILNLRRVLINQKIHALSEQVKCSKEDKNSDSKELLQSIIDYMNLRKLVSNRLNRVV